MANIPDLITKMLQRIAALEHDIAASKEANSEIILTSVGIARSLRSEANRQREVTMVKMKLLCAVEERAGILPILR